MISLREFFRGMNQASRGTPSSDGKVKSSYSRFSLAGVARIGDLGCCRKELTTVCSKRAILSGSAALESSLEAICRKDKAPVAKIHEWFQKLYRTKRDKVLNDPQLYKSFSAAAEERKSLYTSHLTRMSGQLTSLVEEAVARKKLTRYPVEATVAVLFETTTGFHNLKLVAQHVHEKREPLLKQVLDVVIDGLS
jgi:hypothetical protein